MPDRIDREDMEISRTMYALGDMNPIDIYKALCNELKFNTMVDVFRMLKYKIEYLTDPLEIGWEHCIDTCCKAEDE